MPNWKINRARHVFAILRGFRWVFLAKSGGLRPVRGRFEGVLGAMRLRLAARRSLPARVLPR